MHSRMWTNLETHQHGAKYTSQEEIQGQAACESLILFTPPGFSDQLYVPLKGQEPFTVV